MPDARWVGGSRHARRDGSGAGARRHLGSAGGERGDPRAPASERPRAGDSRGTRWADREAHRAGGGGRSSGGGATGRPRTPGHPDGARYRDAPRGYAHRRSPESQRGGRYESADDPEAALRGGGPSTRAIRAEAPADPGYE